MREKLLEILPENDPLFPILVGSIGTSKVKETIENMSLEKFSIFLRKYQRFNDQFAPCVLNLASRIHLYFYDKNMNAIGSEIAAGIYKACVHEYAERIGGKETTHGRLSQKFINKLSEVIKFQSGPEFIETGEEKMINDRVRNFYCSSGSLGDQLGYHIGSELLAAFEFLEINNFTKNKFPDFYKEMNMNSEWHWISIHSEVEIEHFKNAIESYKIFTELESKFQESVISGFMCFSATQSDFLELFSS
jgi:hypothetical protein